MLNQLFLTASDVDTTAMSSLRASYSGSLNALRVVTGTMAGQGSFELTGVIDAVEGLFESSVAPGNASLLLSTVKSHDEYTFFHSVNVCILSLAIGRMIGTEKEQLIPVGVGAVLHDIGKVAVSTAVLNYPGRLSNEQWKEITIHPQEGALAIMAAGGPEAKSRQRWRSNITPATTEPAIRGLLGTAGPTRFHVQSPSPTHTTQLQPDAATGGPRRPTGRCRSCSRRPAITTTQISCECSSG